MYHEALLYPTQLSPPLYRLGDQPDSSSFAHCTPQVLPGHCGPPSGPPSARTGHAQKCVDEPDSSGLRKTLPYATHGAHRGGGRGPLFPLALPAASHAALPPGDPPCARISALIPSKAPTPPRARNAIPPPGLVSAPRAHASAPSGFSEHELRPSAVLTAGFQSPGMTREGHSRITSLPSKAD